MWRPEVNLECLHEPQTLLSEARSLNGTQGSLIRLGEVANKPQEPVCFPNTRPPCTFFSPFVWVLGIELTTSGLHGKHFVVWTISSERVPAFLAHFVTSIVFVLPILRHAPTACQLREYIRSTLEGSSYHKHNFNYIFHYQLSVLDSWVREKLYLVDSFTNSLKFFSNI